MNGTPTTNAGSSVNELTRAGMQALDTMMKSMLELARVGAALNPVAQGIAEMQRRRTCEIPPPCWMPRALGEIHSVVCPGGTAVVRVRVTNNQMRPSQVKAVFAGTSLATEVTPEVLTLSPMERGWITATIEVPADACKGEKTEVLLWVQGCNAHYLRWIVEPADSVGCSCHEIHVDDGPDLVHHWYDHFYCDRPCFHKSLSLPGKAS